MKTDTSPAGACPGCDRPMRLRSEPARDGVGVLQSIKSGVCTACHQRAERQRRNAERSARAQFERLSSDEGSARSAALTVCCYARGVEDARVILDALGIVSARSAA